MIRRAFLAFLFAALGAAAEPNITLIDGPGNVGRYSSVGFSGSGAMVSYYDADNGDLKFATCTAFCDRAGAAWTTTTVDAGGDVGLYTSLGTVAGNPAIAYYDATNRALKLAVCTGNCMAATSTWIVSTVDRSSADIGRYPTLLGGDAPRIVYYDQANGDLKLARCTGACATGNPSWAISTIDATGDVGRFAVARTGFPDALEIAYADATRGRLKMAICTAGCASDSASWILQDIDALATDVDTQLSLALNEGAPSISYYDAAHGDLKLATCNRSCGTTSPEWVVSTIDSIGDAGQWSALNLNGHVPAIAYSGTIRNCNGTVCHEVSDLRLAVCFPDPGHATPQMPCVISTIETGLAAASPAIIGGDSVYITYYDAVGRDLRFAYTHVDEILAVPQNYTSLWWDPEESGWGINFSHQGDIVFATLFTYDAFGAPTWFVMSGGRKQAANVYSGELYTTTGPAFNAQPFTPITPANITRVGTMTVGFAGDSATLNYDVNGAIVNKTLRKQLFVSTRAPRCQPWDGSHTGRGSMQDLWWNSAESGWGINFAQQGDTIFATLFTYDANHHPMWYVMSGGRRQSDGSFKGELYRTSGPPFNAAPFAPIAPGQIVKIGDMQLQFADGESGTLTYSVDGATVVKPITRQVFSTPGSLCGS